MLAAHVYHHAVQCRQCQQRCWVLSLEMGRGELVELLSEQRSRQQEEMRKPWAPGTRGAQGWAEEP